VPGSPREPQFAEPRCISLTLIRHGEQERSGQDGCLTTRGVRQVEAVARAIALCDADVLVSSPRLRARQTALALRAEPEIVDDLDEFRFGSDWTWEHADQREDLALWRPEHRSGAESLAEFHRRVERAVEALVERRSPGRLVLCVHSGVIDVVLRWAFGISPDTPWTTEAAVGHASITELLHWPAGRHVRGAPRHTVLVRLGDVGHLPDELITGRL
jgi:broad specificity phosphatase PhoE